MKKIYLAFVLSLLAFNLFAQRGATQTSYQYYNNATRWGNVLTTTAALQITLPAYGNYSLTIGNQTMSFYGNRFFMENLAPGLLQVSISTPATNGSTWQSVYNGAINFEGNTRLFATIDNYGVLRITQREAIQQQPQSPSYPNTPTPGQPGYYPQVVFATQQQASQLVQKLTSISFDNSKVKAAKAAIKNTNFTAEHIKQVLETFSFDSYKLEVAKYAYDLSYDKANFFVVSAAFDFTSNADKLEEYMLTH